MEGVLVMSQEGSSEGHIPNGLSHRELDVLRGIGEGKTNRQVAEVLGIGIKTVESYRARLVAKLQIRHRSELAEYARRSGLIP